MSADAASPGDEELTGEEGEIELESSVLIQGRHVGVVKFIGTTDFDPSGREWIGVELERPIGKHDGKVKDRRYFTSKPKHGTFVARAQCELYSAEKAAARKIQSAARMKLAKKKVKEEVSWTTFNMLDNMDESMHIHRRNKLLQAGLKEPEMEKLTAAARERIMREVDAMEVEADYRGPRLRFPLDAEQVLGMVRFFRGGGTLHYKYTIQLINQFTNAVGALPTLVETTVNEGERLAVVGDTHGQLQDLFSIFTINGTPDEKNRYLFNGDFVDRGDNGAEIVLTLFAFHLVYPTGCLLNRGNHEERSQNEAAGFLTEIRAKFSGHGVGDPGRANRVYEFFEVAFDNLPLATLITKGPRKVFVVHGGLFDKSHNVRLNHIAAIKRKREIPWGRATFEDRVFEDMMWSDPRDDLRGTEPSIRGAGVVFGADVTERFCAVNGISLVIRSHECVREGFLYQHGDRCLTIFSASRYMATGSNNGAFIVFDSELTNVVQQFMAGPLESTDPKPLPAGATSLPYVAAPAPPAEAADDSAQGEVVRNKIIERVVINKPDLFWYFTHADKAQTGKISRIDWTEAMKTVLRMPDLPWLHLVDVLVDVEADGMINYATFLDRYRIEMREEDFSWQEAIIEKVCERLFRLCSSLEEAYKLFDINSDGRIEYEEFVNAVERLDVGLTRMQIYELMRSIDTDKDSHVDFKEFAARFRVVFTRVADAAAKFTPAEAIRGAGAAAGGGGAESPSRRRPRSGSDPATAAAPVDEWTRAALQRVGHLLFSGGMNAAQVFERMDTDHDSAVSYDEFCAALDALKLDPAFSSDEVHKLMNAIDSNHSGRINYIEFIDAFKIADIGKMRDAAATAAAGGAGGGGGPASASPRGDDSHTWQRGVIEQIVSVLYDYRIELAAAFEKFDLDGSGTVSSEEFRLGLRALTGALGAPLTDMQAQELLKALDKNGDGQLSYAEFLDGFRIVDTKTSKVTTPAPTSPTRRGSISGGASAGGGGGAGTGK